MRCWGFPGGPIVFRFVPVPQGRSFVASLRDGLRPPLTDRPAPENTRTAGKPPKERAGREMTIGASALPGRSPERLTSLRAPARGRLPVSVARHRPPQIATRFSITRLQSVGGWS
ncbi:hypothetical protein B1K54_22170 [Streptomyces sp. fd1-xmd]|nr:hypothetical protein B1K54_22170 [Streptomyces sp. fd1-xmd]